MTAQIKTIHHVMMAIPLGSESEARAFYGSLLGLQELPKPDTLRGRGGLWFRAGELGLHLGVEKDFKEARKAHVAFRVSGLPALRQQIVRQGFVPIEDELLPGFDRFYLDDPFGNRLEFLEPLPG